MVELGSSGNRPAVLYLVHRLPYPPDKGDRIRAFHLVRWLSQRADVSLVCMADEAVPEESLAALRRYCVRVEVVRVGITRWVRALASLAVGAPATLGAFHSRAFESVVRRWASSTRFDVVLASSSGMVPYLRLDETKDLPSVVDLVDVDSQKWLDYAQGKLGLKAMLHALEGRRLGEVERELLSWTRAVTLVSEAEANLLRERVGRSKAVHSVTNGVDLDTFRPRQVPEIRAECVFVGALDYRPNVEGVDWFCHEVWPRIVARRPGARCSLVGRKPTKAVRRLAALPGVDLVGQVDDVRPYIASAGMAVVPLRIARGVQNKVLESLSMGKAVVASPASVEGIEVIPGVHLLTAETAEQWADAIDLIIEDRGLAQRLGRAGRSYVEENHDWDRCLAPFAAILGLDSARLAEDSSFTTDGSANDVTQSSTCH